MRLFPTYKHTYLHTEYITLLILYVNIFAVHVHTLQEILERQRE